MTANTPALVTQRLELRPLAIADSDDIQQLFPHWEIVRHLAAGVPWPYPADAALTFVRDVALPAVARGDEWAWSLRRREDPSQLIGALSLTTKPDENRGFWLARPWRGRGYMTEACEATTAFWFNDLGFARLRVLKAVANAPSRRISERQGMRVVWTGERMFVSGRLTAEVWELEAAEWRRARGSWTQEFPSETAARRGSPNASPTSNVPEAPPNRELARRPVATPQSRRRK